MALDVSSNTRRTLAWLIAGQRINPSTVAESFREILELPAGPPRDVMLSQLLSCSMVLTPSAELIIGLVREALRLDGLTVPTLGALSDRSIVAVAGSGKKMLRLIPPSGRCRVRCTPRVGAQTSLRHRNLRQRILRRRVSLDGESLACTFRSRWRKCSGTV